MGLEIVHDEGIEEAEDQEAPRELAVGLKVPTSVKVPVSYLDGLRKYKDVYNDIYKQMEVCNKLYKFNGIIGNAVDVLIDFAVTKVRPMPTGDKKLDDILSFWFENVNRDNTNSSPGIYSLNQEIGLEWFTSGNAFPYTKWENVKVENQKNYSKLPLSINLINPQSIQIPDGPIAFGQEVIYLKYDADLIDKIRKDGRRDPEAALIKSAIPRSILNSITKRENSFMDGIRLNPKYIKHLKRRAKGYQAWGVPYLTRCFSSVSILERLRELDESIASGLLNLITVFKVGTEEHPAKKERLSSFAALLRNPKATQTLVWAHDIDILQVGPDGKILQFKTKFQDAKEDILTALGIPPVLMSLNQSGDEWVSILSLIERLSHWRNTVSLWLEGVCNDIAKHNGFNKKVKVKWERMNLADDKAIKNLVLGFWDRGLISIETTLKESGYNMDHELNLKKKEKPIKDEFLPPEQPWSGDQSKPKDGRPTDDKDKKKKDTTKDKPVVNMQEQKKRSKPGAKNI
jgi:hypothetical protein